MPCSASPHPAPGSGTDQWLPRDGVRLRYRDEGNGPPVLLLHGWTLDLDMWEPQVSALGERFRLCRFDRRGFGLSGGQADAAQDVPDALALLDALRIPRVACVGMSQGARLALQLALEAPERIGPLVLDGPPDCIAAGLARQADVPREPYRELLRTGGLAAVHRNWLEHPLMQLHAQDPAASALLERMVARYRGTDLLADGTAPRLHAPDTLARLRIPALVMTGALDLPDRQRAADELARLLRAQRVRIPGAGHLANIDAPVPYTATLRSFLLRELAAFSTPTEQNP